MVGAHLDLAPAALGARDRGAFRAHDGLEEAWVEGDSGAPGCGGEAASRVRRSASALGGTASQRREATYEGCSTFFYVLLSAWGSAGGSEVDGAGAGSDGWQGTDARCEDPEMDGRGGGETAKTGHGFIRETEFGWWAHMPGL